AGVKVVGVSRDPMKKHEKFIAKYDLAVPLASDEDGKISDAFGAWVEKSMYGRKYMGVQRATFIVGPDGKIARVFPKVSPKQHDDLVLKALGELATA
ncbi:MAG TPA: redoxin domain-containing protein, partial [Solirubrobacterales bacterium]